MKTTLILAVAVVMSMGACGGGDPTPQEACEQGAMVICSRVFECFTEAERTQLGVSGTEADCRTTFEASANCAANTDQSICDPGETYQADKVDACLSELRNVSCMGLFDPNQPTPACDATCTMP